MTEQARPPGAFAFAIGRPESVPRLKDEVVRAHPGLKLAFSRPGLVTFKDPAARVGPDFGVELVHARVAGVSLGLFDDVSALAASAPEGPLVLHVFPRAVPGEGPVDWMLAHAVRAELEPLLQPRLVDALTPGTLVLDVATEAGEPLLTGLHLHAEGRSRAPGGLPDVPMPARSPSRAYAKLLEALELAAEPMKKGELAVELGCAPGGTTLAMLEAGVSVIGVDPAEMDPGVLAFAGPLGARVRHLRMPVGAVVPGKLPAAIDWLVVDLNLAPPVALRYAARIVRARKPRRGAILTLKMNDAAAIEAIGLHVERVRALGFSRILARQLPANRSEITVIARP